MLAKLGFTLEGTAREHEYDNIAGRFVDVFFLGLLRREYPNEFIKRVLTAITYEER